MMLLRGRVLVEGGVLELQQVTEISCPGAVLSLLWLARFSKVNAGKYCSGGSFIVSPT